MRSLAAELERDRCACSPRGEGPPTLDPSPLGGSAAAEVRRDAVRPDNEEDVPVVATLASASSSSSLAATREALRSVTDLAARLGEAAEEAGESARRSLSSAAALGGAGFRDDVDDDGMDGRGSRVARRRQRRPSIVPPAAAGRILLPFRALRTAADLVALLVAVLLLSLVALGGGAAAWLIRFAAVNGGVDTGRTIVTACEGEVSAQEQGGSMIRSHDDRDDAEAREEVAPE
mmetsp:Transcript_28115/g.82741  ORF Transcript_28115/g.82741 Transcript_28115/m.82741 type:complete len:233 (-) Transcript_28115:190-888(-)